MSETILQNDDETSITDFRNVLAVCDGRTGDETTIRLASDVAAQQDGRIAIMGLVEKPADIGRLARNVDMAPKDIIPRLISYERKRLAALVSNLPIHTDVEIDVRHGKPFLEIVRDVIEHDRQLVIKMAEDWSGAPARLFTSTDQHLLRKCPSPVWLCQPTAKGSAKTVLAAVDVDLVAAAEPETLRALNEKTLRTAAKIAEMQGAALHVLHAWDALGEGMVRMWSMAENPQTDVDDYVRSNADQSRVNLQSLVASIHDEKFKVEQHSVRGAARDIIPQMVIDLSADILVMGSIARTGIPGFIIGNTAEDVLNSISCSVIVVKPEGYVSPVKA
ncbi:MAG: universal stress protein [Pseudomonadota bacterium]